MSRVGPDSSSCKGKAGKKEAGARLIGEAREKCHAPSAASPLVSGGDLWPLRHELHRENRRRRAGGRAQGQMLEMKGGRIGSLVVHVKGGEGVGGACRWCGMPDGRVCAQGGGGGRACVLCVSRVPFERGVFFALCNGGKAVAQGRCGYTVQACRAIRAFVSMGNDMLASERRGGRGLEWSDMRDNNTVSTRAAGTRALTREEQRKGSTRT
nr:hypothetical protein CFP56_46747 [Quercus suber]